jgi:hypothetical protein
LLKINSVSVNNNPVNLGKITVLIGPNNVGKSQFLRDILSIMSQGGPKTVVVRGIDFEPIYDFRSFASDLMVYDNPEEMTYYYVGGLDPTLMRGEKMNASKESVDREFSIDKVLGNLTKFKVTYLDASSRLNISKTATSSPPEDPPQNPLQGLYRLNKEATSEIRSIFNRAFNMDILLDYSELYALRFKVSQSFPDISLDPQEAYAILKSYPVLDEQGDGFKSFVGIVSGFLLSKERLILLDEPEAFLHPKQSRILGNWIASILTRTITKS